MSSPASGSPPSNNRSRFIFFGAHPDDCEDKAAGTAALLAQAGHPVKFVSLTMGDKGHYEQSGQALVQRRAAETEEAARRLGIAASTILDHSDGELMPTLDARKQVIRLIRDWQADAVVSHRPNDYHPDHRYGAQIVQDAAYLVQVPHMLPSVPPTSSNPVFLYFQDDFQHPYPFRHDVVVATDTVADVRLASLDAHASQFYEWLPWVSGDLDAVPTDATARKAWLADWWHRPIPTAQRKALTKWYGAERTDHIEHAESFQIAEYGRQPSEQELRALFPMLGAHQPTEAS
jgi:LmbE family N-acetylglucosaminyl deacetylase